MLLATIGLGLIGVFAIFQPVLAAFLIGCWLLGYIAECIADWHATFLLRWASKGSRKRLNRPLVLTAPKRD